MLCRRRTPHSNPTQLMERSMLLLTLEPRSAQRDKPPLEFCLVEFAMHISKWLREVTITNEDFVYESMESDEGGLVWIKRSGLGWRIGSVHQAYEEQKEFRLEEISIAVKEYSARLSEELFNKLGLAINLQAKSIDELRLSTRQDCD